MNHRKLFTILIALSLILITIPPTYALDEWIISAVDEDVFWSTYRFDENDMMYLQGDNMRIIGWYLFEGPDVLEARKPISEAYLSVRTMGSGLTDLDASMTLYGVPAKEGGALSIYDDLDQINGPYTTSYVNVNLSSFVGAGVWHNITVTNIVREINQGYYFYDGHDVAFVTLSPDNHDAERYVSSEESGFAAKLYVHYETPGTPPGVPENAEWIEEYRNYTIWEVDNLGDNRTGAGADVNWNLLNITQLSEMDSGSDLTLRNDTWVTVIDYQAQVHGCFYNDTGYADIETYFLRFKINVTDVESFSAGNTPASGVAGLSSATPVGGGGLPYGVSGDWVGIICLLNPDDARWRFYVYERSGGSAPPGDGYSPWFTEATQGMLYVEVRINCSGATKWISYDVYDDPEFTNSINYDLVILQYAEGPFRYPQIIPSLGGATGAHVMSHEYYTYLEMPLAANTTIYITDVNGTIIEIIEEFDGNVTDIEDIIDDDIIGYPDPEDPDPSGWEDPVWWSIHRFKLVLFLIGMILLVGSPVYGFAARPEASTWIMLMMNMLIGVALLWSLQTM